VFERTVNKRFGKEPCFSFGRSGRREFGGLAPSGRAFVLGDGRSALGLPEFIQRTAQILRRTQVVLKQELDRAFARFTSFAHSATSA
jgi:hypothetical protein